MSGSLGETLKFEPGISSSFFGTGASRPIIRGQGGLRVLLLDNGIGSIDASSASPDHAAAVEPAMAGRIEVIRGSGLLRYGSAASGGVINVIDGRIPERVPDNGFTTNLRSGLSSVDRGFDTAIGADLTLGQFGGADVVGHAEYSHRQTQDYDIPGFSRSSALRVLEPVLAGDDIQGFVPNSDTKSTSIAAGASYISGENVFGGAVKNLKSQYGVPGGEGSRIKLNQTRYDFSGQFELGASIFERLNVSGGAANYQHKEIEASGEVGTIFSNKGFEGRAEIIQHHIGAWQAAHGVHYKNRDFSALGAESFVPPTTTTQFGLFSFHELDFEPMHFEAAGRYEHVNHQDEIGSIDTSFDGLSGSLGMDYHITDSLKLGGSFYRTERAPTTEELFSNGPHLATNQFEIGTPDLGIETATGAELSLRYQNNHDHFVVNVFHTDYSDYVYEAFTGATFITDEGDELAQTRFTAADAVFAGFEIDMAKHIGQYTTGDTGWDISLDSSVEYVRARRKNTALSPLPRIPPLGITFGVSAQSDRWQVRAELDAATKQDKLAQNELETDAYIVFNGFASYAVNDHVTFRISVHNITNQEARQHTSFLKEQLPLPGRNIKASLTLGF